MVPIEEIRAGDCVLSWNEATGQVEHGEVTATASVPAAPLLEVALIHESGRIETIRTAHDHPFYVVTPGTPPAWTEARLLRGTDLLATISGPATIESVRFSSGRATVYNLSVAGTSNYYIGLDGVLVHNCDFEFHHFFPKQHWTKFYALGFTAKELDEIGERIARDWHKRIHGKGTGHAGSWNDRWEQWFRRHKAAGTKLGKSDAEDYLKVLKMEFGL